MTDDPRASADDPTDDLDDEPANSSPRSSDPDTLEAARDSSEPSRDAEEDLIRGWLPSRCPRCGGPISSVTMPGPHVQYVSPCGCRVTPPETRER